MDKRRSAQGNLKLSQELLAKGDYGGALRKNQEVLSTLGKSTPADKALFNMGLIYAHYENPDKNYAQSKIFFDSLIREYPQSPLVDQAKMWLVTLECLERETQANAEHKIELEKQKKVSELEIQEDNVQEYLNRIQARIEKKDFQAALDLNREAMSKPGNAPFCDRIFFNKCLIYAHHDNPEKDYQKAKKCFGEFIAKYPKSTILVSQAKIWEGTFNVIEKEKQVDIEIEEKKKRLEEHISQLEQAPPDSAPAIVDFTETESSADPEKLVQGKNAGAEEENGQTLTLKEGGGSLSALALKKYGKMSETLCDLILRANPDIKNGIREIDDDLPINMPEITAESYVSKLPDGSYQVYIGTFVSKEVAAQYQAKVGNAKKNFATNPVEVSTQDTWYRLTLSEFPNKEEALQEVVRLEKLGIIYIPREK